MGAGVMMVMTVMEIDLAVRLLKENNGGERKCTVKKKKKKNEITPEEGVARDENGEMSL